MNCVRIAVLLLVIVVPGAWANTDAPVLTLDPAMTKGAPAAPVTIVEFSDYQ